MHKEAKDILKGHGLKVTPARELILTFLGAKRVPRTAQDLCTALGKKHVVDLVTVYRTLASFEKAGIVKRVDLRRDSVAYELAGEHHHHIVCTECGAMEDFELCGIEAVAKQAIARSRHFTTIQEHSLELFGVCDACV